ncbi:hypothetical protein ACQUJT_20370 [Ralstonia pseudosolanacearum]
MKERWESQVKVDDSIVLRRAAQTVGEYWYFFNLLRLHEIALSEGVDLESLPRYSQAVRAGILDENGCLLPEIKDSMYAYSGRHAMLRYWYAREIFLGVLDRISVVNISDRFDKIDLGNNVIKNDIVYFQGACCFKKIGNVSYGPGQCVRGTRSANSVEFVFDFDRWYATSSSANTIWLTGRRAVGCFLRVGDVSRDRGKIVITSTVLAVCSELPGQKNRSYLSSSVPLHGGFQGDDDDDDGWGDEDDDAEPF